MPKDDKYARDKDGKIMKDHRGRSMLASHFVNEPDSLEYFDAARARSTRQMCEQILAHDGYVPEKFLLKEGFKKVNGKWIFHGKPKS